MPITRHVTQCAAPASVATAKRRRTKIPSLAYEIFLCHRHRWVGGNWPGERTEIGEQPPKCGTLLDHRPSEAIFREHEALWIAAVGGTFPAEATGPEPWAQRLKRHSEGVAQFDFVKEHEAIARLLSEAAQVAEHISSGSPDEEEELKERVLMLMAQAETLSHPHLT
ncbi:hypothetical protein AB0H73_18775 [Streptomyces olivoreticuli]